MFKYAVKTAKSIEDGKDYYTVVATGTKKAMMKVASIVDNDPNTVASVIKRSKDGEVVYSYSK